MEELIETYRTLSKGKGSVLIDILCKDIEISLNVKVLDVTLAFLIHFLSP